MYRGSTDVVTMKTASIILVVLSVFAALPEAFNVQLQENGITYGTEQNQIKHNRWDMFTFLY